MTRLRLATTGDSAALAALQARNRAYMAPWEPARPEEYFTIVGQRADLEAALDRHERGDAVPFVILDDDGIMAGRLTLRGIVRGPFQSCSMGCWVAQERAGKGLATDAVATALTHAFKELGLHRVQAETLLDNIPSQRALQRNGFVRYGLAPKYLKIAGRWQDHVMFQRLADEA
ncbi:alanine acetyltransferase [Cryobacterium zongtaii]|uniref:Alanine acetyltransferase n=1 Tax=Cryobacterium zongtaii TaxID=1259217 RepID=A0A2S3ZJZ6_9MICO|nr:GNAT family protein [Cryobacterium zongtaii]POH68328.1 alanine acetyltransferase [Cryobacterium zongtaii]